MRFIVSVAIAALWLTAVPAEPANFYRVSGQAVGVGSIINFTFVARDEPFSNGFITDDRVSFSYSFNPENGTGEAFTFQGVGTDLLNGGTGAGVAGYSRFFRGIRVAGGGGSGSFSAVALQNYVPGPFVDYSVTFIPVAVPEPATWTMLITGFGLLGLAFRRQARTGAATPMAS